MKKGLTILVVASVIALVVTVTLMFTLYEGPGESGTTTIRVFLKDEVTRQEAAALEGDIRNMDGVSATEYISKERALEEFKEMYADDAEMVSQIEGNPFPAEIKVTVERRHVDRVIADLEERPEVSIDSDTGRAEIKNPDVRLPSHRATEAHFTRLVRILVIYLCLLLIGLAFAVYFAVHFTRSGKNASSLSPVGEGRGEEILPG